MGKDICFYYMFKTNISGHSKLRGHKKLMLLPSRGYRPHQTSPFSFHIHLNDVTLSTPCIKYIGVLIDSKLDWSSHVQLVRTKVLHASHLFQ